jgi:hypothetical protein
MDNENMEFYVPVKIRPLPTLQTRRAQKAMQKLFKCVQSGEILFPPAMGRHHAKRDEPTPKRDNLE